MKESDAGIGKIMIYGFMLLMIFGIFMAIVSDVSDSDSYCEEETQFISDQDWYELCK